MKKTKNIILLSIILIHANIYSQITCGTPQNSVVNNFTASGDENFTRNSTPICINVQYHIVRTTIGTGGATVASIDQINNILNKDLNLHNIYVNKIGVDFINNSTYYNMSDAQFNSLVAINNNPNAINFYIINSSSSWGGRAGAITSRNLVINIPYSTSGVASHEFGHCLNLWHTFQGTASGTSGCAENINGSNCTTCGDYVCDTPADARTGITGGYNPDMTNNMSYYDPFYLDHFTILQGQRMYNAINGSPILQPIKGTLCKTILGDESICESPNKSYTLSNSVTDIANWSVTPNLQIVSQTNNSVIIKSTSNLSSTGTLTATVNGASYSKLIKIGTLVISDYSIVGPTNSNVYINTNSYFSVKPVIGATSYYWSLVSNPDCGCYTNSNGFLTCPQGTILPTIQNSGSSATVQWGNCPGTYTLNCYAVNVCGLSGIGNYQMYVSKPGAGGGNNGEDLPCQFRYSVYPNPIKNNNIEISIAPPPGPCPPPPSWYKIVKIYDLQGVIIYENKFKEEKIIAINNLNLKKGNYVLIINSPNRENFKQIIIVE